MQQGSCEHPGQQRPVSVELAGQASSYRSLSSRDALFSLFLTTKVRLSTTTTEEGLNSWYASGMTIANHGRTLVKACV